jgi:hypothetical protein
MNVNFYLVTYDRIEDRVVEQLTDSELQYVKAYCVQKKVPKSIPNKVKIINEWELPWNNFEYQKKQYYEYGAIAHLTNNISETENLTHIGLLHWDVKFNKNSVNEIVDILNKEPNTIFYELILKDYLYLSEFEIINICEFMSEKMNIHVDPGTVFTKGWVSHSLSIVPIEVFKRFGKYLTDYKNEIEEILTKNRWGIMNTQNHRICGLVERMWGFYLMSQECNFKKMNIDHESAYYEHKHMTEANWIKNL